MTLPLIVAVAALLAAAGAFALSASRTLAVDPVDTSSEERAVRRAIARRPRLARFVDERLDRRTAGGLVLTVGFAIVVIVAFVLGTLLDMIDRERGLARLDASVARWGSDHATSRSIDVIESITQLGATTTVMVVLFIVAVVDYVRRRSAEVFVFVAAVGVGQLLINNLLKALVDRDRPAVMQLVGTSGSSFPSGHSAAAAATWAAVALLLGRDRSRPVRAVLAALAAAIAIAVATSRALLGVHWVTDVVAGLVVGWGWFVLVATFFGGRSQRLGGPVDTAVRSTVGGGADDE